MKKIILMAVAVTAITAANAQTKKGDWMVGGNFRLNTSENNTNIGFSPNAAPFVIDNLAVGANLGIDYSKAGDNKVTTFSVGPLVRYYFTDADIKPILQGSLNYLSSKTKIATAASSTLNGTNYFLGGGAAIFLNDQVSLDGVLGYEHTKFHDFDGSGGLALTIGFQVYLHKQTVDKIRTRRTRSNSGM